MRPLPRSSVGSGEVGGEEGLKGFEERLRLLFSGIMAAAFNDDRLDGGPNRPELFSDAVATGEGSCEGQDRKHQLRLQARPALLLKQAFSSAKG